MTQANCERTRTARPSRARVQRFAAWSCLLVICCQVRSALPLAARDPVPIPPHLRAADELVRYVPGGSSSYEHEQGRVHWKGFDGATRYECHTDCSGLLDHLLQHCYGLSESDLRSWLGSKRPTAATYHRAIAGEDGFQRITRLDLVRPGDIIAVKYPKGSGNTGHVMIVARAPTRSRPTAPQVAGTAQWEVGVIDSSSSGHGNGDSRHRNGGDSNSGIGAGVCRLYTDRLGKIAGHTWSTSSSSTFRSQDSRHIEIGRLLPDINSGHVRPKQTGVQRKD